MDGGKTKVGGKIFFIFRSSRVSFTSFALSSRHAFNTGVKNGLYFFQIKNYAVWLVSLKLGCSHRSARASTRLCFVKSTSTKCSLTHICFVTAITAVEKYIPEYCTPVIFRCTAHRQQQLSKSKFFKFAQYNCKFGSGWK